MSASLLAGVSAALSAVLGWRVALLPGSFRGVPFYLNTARGTGGRRLVTHEYPQRDTPDVEDLGQKANVYQLQVFVVGESYMLDRDALISACQDPNTAGILVHPTLGLINCRVGNLEYNENPKDEGGFCRFEIEFRRDGDQSALEPGDDTASQLLAGIGSMLKVAATAYAAVSAILQNPALLVGYAGTLLGGAAGALLGLPPATTLGLGLTAAAIYGAVTNDTATALSVQTAFQGAAANVIASQAPPVPTEDPVLGDAPLFAPVADLTGGLAVLATWGDTLLAPIGAGAALAALQAQQAAIVALVEGAAALAVMTIYAQTDFVTANQATQARAQVLAMIDRQSDAANRAGSDDLYRAWLALQALAIADLIERAQNLPMLVTYATKTSLPSLVLAQLFYQDANRADEMVALNDAPHPMFMPTAGVRLST